jgi:hypothetical protein
MLQKQLLLVLIFLTTLFGCHTNNSGLSSSNYFGVDKCEFVLDQLYFGLKTPNGEVSKKEWELFVNNVIAQKFPNGFTVIDSYGQWLNKNGEIIKENTKVVQIIHENNPENSKMIDEVIAKYKTKFFQESVLRVTSCPWVKF